MIPDKTKANNKIRFIDLFAGLGGIRLGLEQAFNALGIESDCVFSSEIKKHAITAYSNYFDDKHIHGDITKISSENIPDFDILLAGFPCQAFSMAGSRLGFNDTRGTLFFDVERILREKQPYGFILENVEGLVSHDHGNTLKVILSSLSELGYQVSYKVLDAQYFGLAQSRKRIYIVGTRDAVVDLENFNAHTAKFKDIQQDNQPVIDTNFTRRLCSHFRPNQLYGKSIKDKRGGSDNIHSWDLGIKGEVSLAQKQLLEQLLKERRKKKWAAEIGITWMDGMPLTCQQIASFYQDPTHNNLELTDNNHNNQSNHLDPINQDSLSLTELQQMLDDLVVKGYLVLEHPKDLVNGKREYIYTKPKGYNIVTGKLSFEFSKIIDPNSVVPTLVATDAAKLGVVDNKGIRRLTIREAQRLCGFPEDYDLSMLKYSEGLDLLGNTVCVPVIKQIALRLGQKILSKKSYAELRYYSAPTTS